MYSSSRSRDICSRYQEHTLCIVPDVHAVITNLNCSVLCCLLVLAKCFGIEVIVRHLQKIAKDIT
jgi:hypothetical protein